IEIIESGHWKVDLLRKRVTEKGIDTSLAVDLVTLVNSYDVAVVISGDADMIPSINYAKQQGKHIAVVDIINGYPPEKKGRQSSSRLKSHSDFTVPIYEMNLVTGGIGQKRQEKPTLPLRS
ncbi:MAG: NYN domain-containing protein, partial [Chlorobaculum sp.]